VRPGRRERVHRVRGEADRGHDHEEDDELGPAPQEVDARAQVADGTVGKLLSLRPDQQERADEDEVRESVQPEGRRDAEVLDRQSRRRRADRPREVERHRVERDRGRHFMRLDELGIMACCAGAENALTIPSATASAITTVGGARSCHASRPSPPERTMAMLCVRNNSCRRLNLSEAPPAQGASSKIGRNCAKLRTPSSSAEWVCR
jgi:hypothetical protein